MNRMTKRNNSLHTKIYKYAFSRRISPEKILDMVLKKQNLNENTPLFFSLRYKDLSVTMILLNHGAQINMVHTSTGETPLHLAVRNGWFVVTQMLIRRGADVNAKNVEGNTPLHYACFKSQWKIAELLLRNGADPTVNNCRLVSPDMYLC